MCFVTEQITKLEAENTKMNAEQEAARKQASEAFAHLNQLTTFYSDKDQQMRKYVKHDILL